MGILNAAEKKELKELYNKNEKGVLLSKEYTRNTIESVLCRKYKKLGGFIGNRGKIDEFTEIFLDKQPIYYDNSEYMLCVLIYYSRISFRYKSQRHEYLNWKLEDDVVKLNIDYEEYIKFPFNLENYSEFEYLLEDFEDMCQKICARLEKYYVDSKAYVNNLNLEKEANGASAIQIKSNPENVVFCFGKTPRGFNLKDYNYNVYKGWHEDGKACMLRYKFSEPIILTDNKNASGVLALSKKFSGKVLTYDEFLNGGETVTDTFESIARKYSDRAFDAIKGRGTVESKKYPMSYANLLKDKDNYILTETCFAGNQKGLFKIKYVIVDNQGFKNEFSGVAKTKFYGSNDKPLIPLEQFASIVDTLLNNAKQKAQFSKEDWEE